MRRAERLFRLVQFMRKSDGPCTAEAIGESLEVSKRTVYRDIAHLQGSGLPIDGEAGIGYLLRPGFDLPPMTFTTEQIDALALGARLVGAVGDPQIALAAREVLAKLEAVLPREAARQLTDTPLFAFTGRPHGAKALPDLRRAIRDRRKSCITYQKLDGETSKRDLRPLGLICFSQVWLLCAWCELREDFRHFRVDRITELEVLEVGFEDEPGKRLADHDDGFVAHI